MNSTSTTDKVITALLNGEVVDNIELSTEDKKFLFGKAKDFRLEAEFFETHEPNEKEAQKLYDIASKLYEIGSN